MFQLVTLQVTLADRCQTFLLSVYWPKALGFVLGVSP